MASQLILKLAAETKTVPTPDEPFPAPAVALTAGEVDTAFTKTPVFGKENAAPAGFVETCPEAGLLVGLSCTAGTAESGLKIIQSIQPLYISSGGRMRGAVRGAMQPGSATTEIWALPGFAVSAIRIKSGAYLEGFQLCFTSYFKGAWSPAVTYTSPWCGGGAPQVPVTTLKAGESPFCGVFGQADGPLRALGFLAAKDKAAVLSVWPDLEFLNFGGLRVAPEILATLARAGAVPPTIDLRTTRFDRGYVHHRTLGNRDLPQHLEKHDFAPLGGILCGLDVALGKSARGTPSVQAVTAVYLVGNSAKASALVLGKPGSPNVRPLRAKPGYAVGGIEAAADETGLSGFKLVFMRIKGAGLDLTDSYDSEFVGGDAPGHLRYLTDGRCFMGLDGTYTHLVNSFSLLAKNGFEHAGPDASHPPTALGTAGSTPPARASVPPGEAHIFATAGAATSVFLNGTEILKNNITGFVSDGFFPLKKGDVLAIEATSRLRSDEDPWVILRAIRDGRTLCDTTDLRYLEKPSDDWKTAKTIQASHATRLWIQERQIGNESFPYAMAPVQKRADDIPMTFKLIVP